ncbi:MAG TPA: preprotein translocase subunit YajC [Gemmatimonadaceae bacterium]|jgi:preprotein translocase subunit YajC|nr:preprotein translocase subunit YajC [Gemmatimonadaceae bacterium]
MTTPDMPLALMLAQAGGGGGSTLTPFIVQFALIIAIIYFIMVRPQQKQRRQHEAALRALKRGDEVVTTGGIVGEVIHIREMATDAKANKMDDRVTIKSAESRLVVERGRIARIITTTTPAANAAKAPTAE